jgi:hypothetical protein
MDNWDFTDHMKGKRVPLRADSWYQKDPTSDPIISSGNFSGIQINIWNRAKVRRFITHSLTGGGRHSMGCRALR